MLQRKEFRKHLELRDRISSMCLGSMNFSEPYFLICVVVFLQRAHSKAICNVHTVKHFIYKINV
jgi:hypothetical protein